MDRGSLQRELIIGKQNRMKRIFTIIIPLLFLATTVNAQPAQKPKKRPAIPPTHANVAYGTHERQVLDLWLAESERPTPVLISIHGGGFRRGEKSVSDALLKGCLESGISVAAINYRYSQQAIAPAQHHDAARAVQFLRLHADQWNLDPKRFAATGGSAGAGMSLWLGFHDDLADPQSADPVLRQSTRLTCVAVNQAQSSYDPRFIRDLYPELDVYRSYPLAQLFGVDLKKLDDLPPEKYALFEEISALPHLTKDDPPVLMTYDNLLETPISDRSVGIHHPRFGKVLKERMEKLGLECEVQTGFATNGKSRSKQVLKFVRRHFGIDE